MIIATLTTCKGRLEHLKQTLPPLLEFGGFELACLVDWDCPDRSGQWFAGQFEGRATRPIVVTHVGEQARYWHKTAALNSGARAAFEAGAEALVCIDADTIVTAGFGDAVRAELKPGLCLISGREPGDFDVHGLTGLLAVTREDFERVGGYAESFQNWGPEDLEMRLRLHLLGGCTFRRLPLELTSALPHPDEMRDRWCTLKKADSMHALDALLRRRLREWGHPFDRLTPAARALLYRSRDLPHLY